MTRRRVGVMYGGRSGEHEVSIASAAAVIEHLDRARYEPVPIYIARDGRWHLPDRPPTAAAAAEVIERARSGREPVSRAGGDTVMPAHPGGDTLVVVGPGTGSTREFRGLALDVVFPVLHGPFGEDGTVQGLLELAGVPYVGSGVLASAVGMDKVMMKRVFAAHGLPSTAWEAFRESDWNRRRDAVCGALHALGLPVFVKPANLGSSVGISKVKHAADLPAAVEAALAFDRKVIVEAAVPEAREIECAVLGNDEPEASVAGEVVPAREFYDYEAKYLDAGSRTMIPASLPPGVEVEVRRLSLAAFRAIDACGLARVDFLLSRSTGALVINEINTMPGFTTISMYAKLWEASGLGFTALVDRLIDFAVERHGEARRRRTRAV